jgi:hypothetical protein
MKGEIRIAQFGVLTHQATVNRLGSNSPHPKRLEFRMVRAPFQG